MSFIREVRTHVLNVRYGRPNMHNNFVSTTTIGGVEVMFVSVLSVILRFYAIILVW